DWRTIITLSGLMMLTKGVELSGYFDVLGRKMVRRFATERKLALFMVFSAALLSTFLTNDVALFIVVPLTLTLRKLCEIPVTRLIIFEALAVNAGSLLTPIGNPQNILLWGRSGLSFTAFTGQMAPLALAIVASLLAVGWFAFPNKSLQYHSGTTGPQWQPRLVWSCLG
ncbi:anion transporter, partial [Klebsiella pneumoniae]